MIFIVYTQGRKSGKPNIWKGLSEQLTKGYKRDSLNRVGPHMFGEWEPYLS
jgi:hypothetical protein